MYDHYKEAALPLTYRRREITCLIRSLAMERSVRVAGLSGMGKSNLLRFFVSHPQILRDTPALAGHTIYFLHIDCNKLNPINALSFYREGLFLLKPGAEPASADEQLAFKQLEAALRRLDEQTLVIMVVDRTERLFEATGPELFSQLRSLRDEARAGRMMFILGSQRPLGDLHELEKLFSDTCWVDPLAETDRAEIITRHKRRLGLKIGEKLQKRLWDVSGAHPGFLKNSLEWVNLQGEENIPEDEAELIQDLLRYKPIQNYCLRLWENLSPVEQNFLPDLESNLFKMDVPSLLNDSGLVIEKQDRFQLFSPLWAAYLKRHIWSQQDVKPMEIRLDPATRRVVLQWRDRTTETTITRALVYDFLQTLAEAPGQIYSKDDLINAIYHDEKAPEVMDDALFQLVTALRKALDELVRQLCPAMTQSCVQNVRGVGYRLVVDLPTTKDK